MSTSSIDAGGATRVAGFTVRAATATDAPLILDFIRALAEYERLADEVRAELATLGDALFGAAPTAEALIGEFEGRPAAFAVYFHNFSTFLGRPGLYLEDLFVKPEFRGRGFGRVMLEALAGIARARGCGRFEWSVLDWNTPAIEFYKKLGAQPMDQWTVYRVAGEALDALADAAPRLAPEGASQDGVAVRRAALADVDALAPLFDAYRQFYAKPAALDANRVFLHERLARDEAVIYGAWREREALGFMLLYPSWSSLSLGRVWHLNDLWVRPEWRGRGIADRLLREADALARATGAVYLALETTPDNAAAQRLYAKHGWTRDTNLLFLKRTPPPE